MAANLEALEVYEAAGVHDRAARVNSRLGSHFASLGVVTGLDLVGAAL